MSAAAPSVSWSDFHAVSGRTLEEISQSRPALVVFLRHAGCTFCREALGDLQSRRKDIEALGTQIVIVYQESAENFRPLLEKYGMADVEQFSDPERRMYDAFELRRGSIGQLFNIKTMISGFRAALMERHGFAKPTSDVYTMPGAFLIHRGQILRAFRHKTAADRPDYAGMACPL